MFGSSLARVNLSPLYNHLIIKTTLAYTSTTRTLSIVVYHKNITERERHTHTHRDRERDRDRERLERGRDRKRDRKEKIQFYFINEGNR